MMNNRILYIDVKDLIVYISKKWQYLLAAILLFALVLSGYRELTFTDSPEVIYSEESRQGLISRLTETEVNEIENLFDRYLAYKKSITYSESYLGNSILMKLNPDSLPSLIVQYSVTSTQQDIRSTFTTQSLGQNEYTQIASIIGNDTDVTRVSEIVSISERSIDKDGMSLDVDDNSNLYVGINNNFSWVVNLSVNAFSKEQCNMIMDVVENAVNAHYQSLIDAGLEISMTRIGSNYTENASPSLVERQREAISEASSLKAEYDEFEKANLNNLSSEENAYFSFLKRKYEGRIDRKRLIKYTAIGGITGFVVVLFVITILYFASDRIKNCADYRYCTGNDDILSNVYTIVRRKGIINRLINRIINKWCYGIDDKYNTTETAQIVAKRICQICDNMHIDNLYIINDSSEETASSILTTIINGINEESIVVFCGKPLTNSDDYDAFRKTKAVVYYGHFFDSKNSSLSNYVKLIKENDSIQLGSVLYAEV